MEYPDALVMRLSLDNVVHFTAGEFPEGCGGRRIDALPDPAAPGPAGMEEVNERIKECFEDPDTPELVAGFAAGLNADQRAGAARRLVELYPSISRFKAAPAKQWRGNNLDLFIGESVKVLPGPKPRLT